MRNYTKIIDRFIERFHNHEICFNDYTAVYLLANLRQLIEENQAKKDYPVTDFYACWALHTQLDRNSTSKQILISIANSLTNDTGKYPYFIETVCENLSTDKLFDEILDLGNKYNFRHLLNNRDEWNKFLGVIINLVTYKPLCLPVNLAANTSLRISKKNSALIEESSTLRLWLHGEACSQAEWSIAIVPDGQTFSFDNIQKFNILNGGVFTRL